VLFDLDNTLVDTDSLTRQTLIDCGAAGVESMAVGQLRSCSPAALLVSLSSSAGRRDFERHLLARIGAGVELLDAQARQVLDTLVLRKVLLGIVTSRPKAVAQALLRSCKLKRFFESCLVTYGSCGARKPHPGPLITALRMLGHPCEGAIYVGDSQADAQASRSAGVHFGYAGWARPCGEPPHADLFLKNMSDLLQYT